MKAKRLLNFLRGKGKRHLALDFGSSSIKGFVFETGEGTSVTAFSESPVKEFGVFDGRDFRIETIKRPAITTLREIEMEDSSGVDKIISFSPDFLKARVFNISYQRKEEGHIKKEEENQIHQTVLKRTENRFSKEVQWNGLQKLKIIKSSILEERAAGYRVDKIEGINEKDLDFKVMIVFVREKHWKFINHLLFALSLRKGEIFHSAELLSNFFEGPGTFIDIGSKNTLVISFKDGIEGIDDFPIGGDNFTKILEDDLGISKVRANYLKKDYSEGNLSDETSKKIESTLDPILQEWKIKLKRIVKEEFVPFISGSVHLLGGGASLPRIKESIGELGAENVTYLMPDDLKVKNKTKSNFKRSQVSSLLLIFARK